MVCKRPSPGFSYCRGGEQRGKAYLGGVLNSCRRVSAKLCFTFAISVLCLDSAPAVAQEGRRNSELYNRKTLLQTALPDSHLNHLGFENTISLDDFVHQQLNLDNIEDVVVPTERQQGFSAYYRNVYQQVYLDDTAPSSRIEALDFDSDIAERVAVYQSSVSLSQMILRSPLGDAFRTVATAIRDARDYTTLRVGHSQNGSLGLTDTKSRPLMELRLGANPRRGIEPRLRIGDNVVMRYDTREHAPIIEYNMNF